MALSSYTSFFSKINPSTRVQIDNLIFKLSLLRMSNFKQNVIDLLDAMQALYNEIDNKQGSPSAHYENTLFIDLLSGTDADFKCIIEGIKDDWDIEIASIT